MAERYVGVLIQARMGSSRLPGKTMMDLAGKPLIDHVIERCISAVAIDDVVVVTTNLKEDNVLETHIRKKYSIHTYRGDPLDVRSRFEAVAKECGFERIVRVTADDPFKDPNHIQEAIQALNSDEVDYFNNFEIPIYPIGLDVESFKAETLFQNIATDNSDKSKEHVTYGIRHSPHFLRQHKSGEPEFTKVRLTIDTPEDFSFCSKLLEVNPEMGHSSYDWASTREALLSLQNTQQV
jgi:spore coat polysaccharide biosynthesis protein SpsF (cytidylyltransferase family)